MKKMIITAKVYFWISAGQIMQL